MKTPKLPRQLEHEARDSNDREQKSREFSPIFGSAFPLKAFICLSERGRLQAKKLKSFGQSYKTGERKMNSEPTKEENHQ